MMTFLSKILGLSLILISFLCFALPPEAIKTDEKTFELSLPVNLTTTNKISLLVKIPQNFRSIQPLDEISSNKSKNIEFVPKNDGDYNWTQIITLNPFIGSHIQASKLVDSIKGGFMQDAQQVKVLEHVTTKEQGYEKSCMALDYKVNQRHEMVYMCYYSGPYDCTGIQYAHLWPEKNAPTQSHMLTTLKKFVNQHSKIEVGGK